MTSNSDWAHALVDLLALASRLEGEGQYNLAKLARATADSLGRRKAFLQSMPGNKQGLPTEIENISVALSRLEVSEELIAAFRRGAIALSEGRLPSIQETPHPYVCRTCGAMALGSVTEKCPTCGAWPDTFQRFPPVYWLDALDPPAALKTLRQTPLDVAALLEGLSEEQMSQPQSDGGWEIRNVLTHLRDAQGVLDYRLDLFSKEENPVLEAKAVWSWATEEHAPTALEIFESYKTTRVKILARLELLPLVDWWRAGQHEEFGSVSLKQQVSYFASHELTHLPQIEKLQNQFK